MKSKQYIFVLFLLFASCVSVSGLYTGYETLTEEQKKKVIVAGSDISNLRNDGNVYRITVDKLKKYLKTGGKVVVYDYKPKCLSKECVSPVLVENFCKQNNVYLCLVTADLDGIFEVPRLSCPILFMDNEPYKTQIQYKYERLFLENLTEANYQERGYGRFLCFDGGQYIGTFDKYKDAVEKLCAKDVKN